MPPVPTPKTCRRCRETKPPEQMAKQTRADGGADGLSAYCLDCFAINAAETARHRAARLALVPPNPGGLCRCGCGQATPIADKNRPNRGWVRGQPKSYLPGHQFRSERPEYEVDPATGCWVWQRGQDGHGYGAAAVGRRMDKAHRVIWRRLRGPIPTGRDLHHRCPGGPNRLCVNPDHLEPLTRREHMELDGRLHAPRRKKAA